MPHLPLLTCLLILPLGSCISHWEVTKASEPNPIVGHQWFKLIDIGYSQLTVDSSPEDIFMADMDAFQLEDWQADKEAIKSKFALAFQEHAGRYSIELGDTGDYTIRPTVTAIETGPYQFPAYRAVSRIYLTLEILDPSGRTIDEIKMNPEFPWDFFNAPWSGRLRSLATQLGTRAGEYLIQRAIQR